MPKEGILKKITRRFKKKSQTAKVSGDTVRIIKESKKNALFGAPEETTKTPSSIEIHKYSSSGNIFIHVMFTNNLKHAATRKDPITRKIKKIEIGRRGTDYYDKGGKLLY